MACAIVTYGRTQSSKSTTVGKLKKPGQAMPVTGDGAGESVTVQASVIDTQLGLMLDTPGIDDTRLRFTDDEAGRRVALGVAASGVNKVKFLIFESLANDAMQLRGTLEKLNRAFGATAARAACVLATKADMLQSNPERRERRLNLLREVITEQSLHGPVLWQNEAISEADYEAQLAELRATLAQVEEVTTTDLQDLRERQRRKAQELCDAYPTQTKTTEVEVDEQYTVPRQEQQAYQEPYVEEEQFTESYEVPETYQVPEQHSYTYEKRRGGIAGLLGDTKTCTGYHTVMVQKVKMVSKTRSSTRPVPKTRTAYRTVTKHDTKTRKKMVPKTVEYRLTVDRFMDEALQMIIEEVRQGLGRL
mmetsp:Transcript_13274/g.23005  ORF Transcript_13274/g.23005 Transcript_13274/m.23005 type:complete len:362 (+) Transcript_13274:99-1184(+)